MHSNKILRQKSPTLLYAFILALIVHGGAIVLVRAIPAPQHLASKNNVLMVVVTKRPTTGPVRPTKLGSNKSRKKSRVVKSPSGPSVATSNAVEASVETTLKPQVMEPKSDLPPTILHTSLPSHQSVPISTASIITTAQKLKVDRAELARITADFDRTFAAHAQHIRRKVISVTNSNPAYAAYLEAWQSKVESVGNANYPEEVRRLKLYGDLILQVTLQADGSLQYVRVVHSSGYPALDAAAIRIVNLAAPFAPFPEVIRKEVDILDIIRTWEFLPTNH